METPADHDSVAAVHRAAFGGETESRLVDTLRRAPDFIPGLSVVAETDGAVVGHILFSPIMIRGAPNWPALALAPMAVLPGRQRRGVGSALVRFGLDAARRLGHDRVIVVGHAEYYPRFGFRPASAFGILAPFDVPDDAFMVLELRPGALDDCSGRVCYPPAFSDV
jgi:putative acetyltransferase